MIRLARIAIRVGVICSQTHFMQKGVGAYDEIHI